MSIKISQKVVNSAKAAITTYQTTADTEFEALKTALTDLTANGFIGDAATGYMAFFKNKITPALTTNLTSTATGSLMSSLQKLVTDVGVQFMDTLDVKLETANENAGNPPQTTAE